MITVLSQNMSIKPTELGFKTTYDSFKKALIKSAGYYNLPIEATEDSFCVTDGSRIGRLTAKSTPCLAVCHPEHKKDYHSFVLELKEAYGGYYLYIHTGGYSKNQRDINLRNASNSFLSNILTGNTESKLKDEELYYDAVIDCIAFAVKIASDMAANPQPEMPEQAHSPKSNNSKPKQTATTQQRQSAATQPNQTSAGSFQAVNSKTESKPVSDRRLDLPIGIGTAGGVFTKIIEAGTTLPVEKSMVFATACDGQTTSEFNILKGYSEKADENIILKKCNIEGITSAPAGEINIKITVNVNYFGTITLTAKETNTGKKLKVIFQDSPAGGQKSEAQKNWQPQTSVTIRLRVSRSDMDPVRWTDTDLRLENEEGERPIVINRETYLYHHVPDLMLPIRPDSHGRATVKVVESIGTFPEQNLTIGKLILSNVTSDMMVSFDLYVDLFGKMTVKVRKKDEEAYLPITFVPEKHSEDEMTLFGKYNPDGKRAVDQLKELSALFKQGALTREEFEDIKKSIIYK